MRSPTVCLFVSLALFHLGCTRPRGDTVEERRAYINDVASETVEELRRVRPGIDTELDAAAGYGVFTNLAIRFGIGGGTGYGLVLNNANRHLTYMRMNTMGLGFGVDAFKAVFLFKDQATLEQFLGTKYEFSSSADTATRPDSKIRIYRFTKDGVDVQAAVQGTRYSKDAELNKSDKPILWARPKN